MYADVFIYEYTENQANTRENKISYNYIMSLGDPLYFAA